MSIGFGVESTYGTYAPATLFFGALPGAILEPVRDKISAGYLRTGELYERSTDVYFDRWKGTGSVTFPVQTKAMPSVWRDMLGTSASGAPSGGFTPWTITSSRQPAGRGLSAQLIMRNPNGTEDIRFGRGGKIITWELSGSPRQALQLTLGMRFAGVTLNTEGGAPTKVTPTPAAGDEVYWGNGIRIADGVGNVCAESFRLSTTIPFDDPARLLCDTLPEAAETDALRSTILTLDGVDVDATWTQRILNGDVLPIVITCTPRVATGATLVITATASLVTAGLGPGLATDRRRHSLTLDVGHHATGLGLQFVQQVPV
jgi:hypothetical protein